MAFDGVAIDAEKFETEFQAWSPAERTVMAPFIRQSIVSMIFLFALAPKVSQASNKELDQALVDARGVCVFGHHIELAAIRATLVFLLATNVFPGALNAQVAGRILNRIHAVGC